jgi:signal transduction histidine kinase
LPKSPRDVTHRYEAQRAFKQTQEQLAAAQKMEAIGQLSGGIAHDFNNLLMIVLGYLETIERYAKSLPGHHPNLGRAITNALRGANRASVLTSRLLAFSRRQALSPKPVELNKFLVATAEFMKRTLGETVEIDAVGGAGLWQIEVDPTYFETALLNLSINARDAMPAGGKITIEAVNVFADEEYCRKNPEVVAGQYVVVCAAIPAAACRRRSDAQLKPSRRLYQFGRVASIEGRPR